MQYSSGSQLFLSAKTICQHTKNLETLSNYTQKLLLHIKLTKNGIRFNHTFVKDHLQTSNTKLIITGLTGFFNFAIRISVINKGKNRRPT